MTTLKELNNQANSNQPPLHTYKLVLVGEIGCGKSALMMRFVEHQFVRSELTTTVGAAYKSTTIPIDDSFVKFDIWDTAGQEVFYSLTPMYYRGAQAAVVVYDITKMESLQRAKKWVEELSNYASPNIVIALAGNKSDLTKNREVDYTDGEDYALANDLIFMETSAKTGELVDDLFFALARKLSRSKKPDGYATRAIQVSEANTQQESAFFSRPTCCR